MGFQSPRRGTSLINLLVLLAVLALFTAMLIPAIQKVREAANRLRCGSNQHNLGIALHTYHNDFDHFPGMGVGNLNAKDPNSGSWCARALPYVEQQALYKDLLDKKAGKVPVKVFYCPARRQPLLYDDLPKTDYAGCTGAADDPTDAVTKEGFLGTFGRKRVTLVQFVDGSSNTLVTGDKGLRSTEYTTGKWAGDKKYSWYGGTIDTLRSSNGAKRPPALDVADADHEKGFGSCHADAMPFMWADGSVRSIRYTIEGKWFQYLCTWNDGVSVPTSAYE